MHLHNPLQEKFKAVLFSALTKNFVSESIRRHMMKNLRQLCAGLMLAMVFTLPAFAGEIDCGVTSPQSPQPTVTATGQIDTTLKEAAVSLIQSILSLS
jgi:hypothetical protein